jgi:hypothetical protein
MVSSDHQVKIAPRKSHILSQLMRKMIKNLKLSHNSVEMMLSLKTALTIDSVKSQLKKSRSPKSMNILDPRSSSEECAGRVKRDKTTEGAIGDRLISRSREWKISRPVLSPETASTPVQKVESTDPDPSKGLCRWIDKNTLRPVDSSKIVRKSKIVGKD